MNYDSKLMKLVPGAVVLAAAVFLGRGTERINDFSVIYSLFGFGVVIALMRRKRRELDAQDSSSLQRMQRAPHPPVMPPLKHFSIGRESKEKAIPCQARLAIDRSTVVPVPK